MIDLYLRAADEAAMNTALLDVGLIDDEGIVASGVSLDVIGPIVRVIGYDEAGEPIVREYPEWHVNVRVNSLTDEQSAALQPITVVPPEVPYRVWA